jgi:tRNA(fMet)-specific endonuclease VapC
MIVLDADILIEIFEKKSDLGEKAFLKIKESMDEFATTSISLHEVLFGLKRHPNKFAYIETLPVLNYSKEDAILSAELEYNSEIKGKKVNRPDAMIAAIAINNQAKLFTFNKKHFENMDRLELFDKT